MQPVSPAQVSALLQQAGRHQAAGRLAEARGALETALKADPNIAVAQFSLAQILLMLNQQDQALIHLDLAADLKPDEPAIWKQYAATLLWLGDPARNAAFLDKAKRARLDRKLLIHLQETLRPVSQKSKANIGSAPPSQIQRAIEFLRKGQHQNAMDTAAALARAHPNVAIIWDILANAQAELGRIDEAEQSFRRAVQLDPSYAEARANFGQFLLRQTRYTEAITELREALRLMPKQPLALTSLGTALHRQARHTQAITFLKRALALDPNIVMARLELAECYLSTWQPGDVIAVLDPIKGLQMPNAKNRVLRARALAGLQHTDAAETEFDAAQHEATHKMLALTEKASFLQTLGRFEEAETLFRQAIDLEPLAGDIYRTFIVTKKLSADDPLIAKMEDAYANPAMTGESRMYMGFAMAKAMEDTGQYDRVFSYLRPANDKMRDLYPYDIAEHQASERELLSLFKDADFTPSDRKDASDFAPIFVTGLPRSGTTLVEQIIASQSRVTGGGELSHAYNALEQVIADHKRDNRKTFHLADKQLASLGEQIEARMREAYPGADIITDKGIKTYTVIGAVHKIFPKAKFIVVRRDPRDTLLSMYKNTFAEGQHRYTNNLRDLAIYYQGFLKVLEFWREKLPGSFHEIVYEELIADPEAEARKLIAACGLDWEDQCLAFHENKRRVSTLSVHQVRQPLYASSLKAWQRYEADLGDLFEALGPEFDPGQAGLAGGD